MDRMGYGHGDVTIIPAVIPAGARRVDTRILARGEAMGHVHRLTDEADVEVYEDTEGTLWLRVGVGNAPITHEEHGVGVIEYGTGAGLARNEFRVGRRQEYDHFAEEARKVQD